MRRLDLPAFILFFLSVFLFFSSGAYAGELVAQSKVSEVTVFADRAAITRTAVVEVPAGSSVVVFKELPVSLMTNSLRARGKSVSAVTLGAIESKQVSSVELVAPKERELSDKIEALKDQLDLVQADQTALAQKDTFLRSLSEQAAARAKENISVIDLKPDQWQKSASAIEAAVKETLRALAAKGVENRELNRKIEALSKDLEALRTGARASIEVRLPLESQQAARLALQISYQLRGARWNPVYDARLDTQTGKIAFVRYGEVRQHTGEDWQDVKLTLSTAQPARGASLPPLSPMWVDLFSERNVMKSRLKMTASDGVMAAPIGAGAQFLSMEAGVSEDNVLDEEKEVSFAPATVKASDYVGEFETPGLAFIPADGSVHKVMIGALSIESTLVSQIKPQFDSASAYLVAQTKLAGETPILPGMANLFRDGAFVGTMRLPLLKPGQKTDFGFGVDDQIAVKVNTLKDEKSETGVIAKDDTRVKQMVVELQNLHKKPVKLSVLQTVPTAKDKEITVTLDKDYTTPGYEENVDHVVGQLGWSKTVEPQEKWDVKLGWQLSWPKGKSLVGLR
ncbi:MAG: mucoidy inhibitor MuiA family protein [Bdellovibrionales bacterium]